MERVVEVHKLLRYKGFGMMADTADHAPPQFEYEERFSDQLEMKKFNTGPRADKSLPKPVAVVGVGNHHQYHAPPSIRQPTADDYGMYSSRQYHHSENHPFVTPSYDGSNLSAQESYSDRELEPVDRLAPKIQTITTPGDKKQRKRKRNIDGSMSITSTTKGTGIENKKITEFIKQSPKRYGGSYSNGDNSSSNDLINGICVSPNSGGLNNIVPTFTTINNSSNPSSTINVQRLTPNHLASNYSSGDSNLSPPTTKIRVDSDTQTDHFDTEAIRVDNDKKNRYIEDLLKKTEELKNKLNKEKSKNDSSRATLKTLLIENTIKERKLKKTKVMEECLRIGQFKPMRHGEQFKDVWQDGWAFEDIQKKMERINNEKNEINVASNNLKKRKPTNARESKRPQINVGESFSVTNPSSSSSSLSTSYSMDDGFVKPELPKYLTVEEYYEQDEILRLRREHLKKEEADVQMEKDRLERERNLHIRELKRVQYEENSRFKTYEELNNRYLCLSLLGKGGFSEVWRAFDLEENRYVACKIHHVNKDWKEDKKANYVKHAVREKDIHKSLDHPRIVRLFDLFTIDNHCFCTVLEYCDGNDLDFYLKQHKQIPEKEARSIMMQIVSALKYLSERKPPVIHYDLKPANILLKSGTTSGEIKITDFGLSKIMENADDSDNIELTSQGAGTYWYLPPETFVMSHTPVKISSKVDVWSVGVIFYQCLYGRRPFGHELTQQRILEENTILKATEVVFPPKPQITSAAQDFIKRCLQYRKEERADVQELSKHELFRPRGQKSQPPSSPLARTSHSKSDYTDQEM
ncbi:Serine/threonine-protein kinase tousled-like 2 [Strongyloides ratti]|uniref:Serine/threonine-protein kinase tousled-like 2 n=1 Tax=Strongyloides ratti TaxID=34506 RepID=A0A090LCY8_STRRB|nr:Serine/threonine-protein kinase tousled-like 2 [Strongyloides ratti]CEF65993.1 Serine/threonine-protein kinase tousled-like 2 [Strongyloides ratti]